MNQLPQYQMAVEQTPTLSPTPEQFLPPQQHAYPDQERQQRTRTDPLPFTGGSSRAIDDMQADLMCATEYFCSELLLQDVVGQDVEVAGRIRNLYFSSTGRRTHGAGAQHSPISPDEAEQMCAGAIPSPGKGRTVIYICNKYVCSSPDFCRMFAEFSPAQCFRDYWCRKSNKHPAKRIRRDVIDFYRAKSISAVP